MLFWLGKVQKVFIPDRHMNIPMRCEVNITHSKCIFISIPKAKCMYDLWKRPRTGILREEDVCCFACSGVLGTGFCCIVSACLELVILLPEPFKCQDYRCVISVPNCFLCVCMFCLHVCMCTIGSIPNTLWIFQKCRKAERWSCEPKRKCVCNVQGAGRSHWVLWNWGDRWL